MISFLTAQYFWSFKSEIESSLKSVRFLLSWDDCEHFSWNELVLHFPKKKSLYYSQETYTHLFWFHRGITSAIWATLLCLKLSITFQLILCAGVLCPVLKGSFYSYSFLYISKLTKQVHNECLNIAWHTRTMQQVNASASKYNLNWSVFIPSRWE